MIKKLEIEGELTIESRGKQPWLAIDEEPLSEMLPFMEQKPWAQIEKVVVKEGDELVPAEGFWKIGDRISIDAMKIANMEHDEAPEEKPLYLGRLIEAELGKVIITIEFVTE